MLIDMEEVKTMIKEHLPGFASKHPGVKLLISFVGKTVNAVNNLDARLKKIESSLGSDGTKGTGE
jgi:hypothetical protein